MSAPLPNVDELYAAIQKACLPGVWSKGVAHSRNDTVIPDSVKEDEIILRVLVRDKVVSPRVTLWPEDEDWYCDCGDRNDPCAHIAAAVIAVKAGIKQPESAQAPKPRANSISYRFTRKDGSLSFDRFIGDEVLTDSLVALMGGIGSGRIQARSVPATKEDFGVDAALEGRRRGVLDRPTLSRLLGSLERFTNVFLDGQPVTTSSQTTGIKAVVVSSGEGFRVFGEPDATVTEIFQNGVALCGSTLKLFRDFGLTPQEAQLLSAQGQTFAPPQTSFLVTEILPALRQKVPLEVRAPNLPQPQEFPLRMVLQLEPLEGGVLTVMPSLVYGDPPVARIRLDRVETLQPGAIPIRDLAQEKNLIRKLQNELHLTPGQFTRFQGESAVDFNLRLENSPWETSGKGAHSFRLQAPLQAELKADENGAFDLSFATASSGGDSRELAADPARVFQAWRENSSYVPLLGGGWAPLPKDWLTRYGERIQALLNARTHENRLPRHLLPELAQTFEELGQPLPDPLRNLKKALETFEGIPQAPLPEDLTATLRSYQIQGVNWLSFLRDQGMGALLADDMGLGKTLQALCAIRGKTLVVMPTSVMHSWDIHLKKFRPGLRYNSYYGPARKLDPQADVTLTTYALLRLDQEELCSKDWDTVILDEAQTIKNPESQVAKAAHRLKGRFRIALSGTPVENRLDDLWSQFHFLNPGLLGSRETFQDTFANAIQRGDTETARRLRRRIKPFLLRRLKKEVAPELPPRTETVLECELAPEEKQVYEAIFASTRQEVLEKLEAGGNIMAALELLLRLRQACCHVGLIPGQEARTSSKVDLLLQTLENSIALGHRALIFSQWTGLLDRIEPHLQASRISFSRLDGSTPNRQEVVEKFQAENGPSAMLISLKAGGVGLTLTAADHIFLMDPWWNPAVEDQAADRAHRIGQKNPVLIQRLVAKDTIEEKILLLQEKKLQIAGSVLQDTAAAISLTRDDLLDLLR